MKHITSVEGRNRVGHFMSVQGCDPKSYSSAPVVHYTLPGGATSRDRPHKTCGLLLADYRAKPRNVSKREFSEHDPYP